MAPAAYVRLETLPLSLNGKLDRKALPAADGRAYIQREFAPPLGKMEQTVAAVWSEVLQVERVGRYDNFFELGGHSLLAVRMISQVYASSGVTITLRDLFMNPTLADFTSSIARATPESLLPSNLTSFRRTGASRPIFFIHSGLGDIGFVNALLPGIDPDTPVYGFAAVGYFTDERPLDTAEEIAATYIRGMRQIQPQGPYRLAGWSAGGNIAYEMANQLLKAEQPIEFLGLLDSTMGLSPSANSVDPSEQVAEALARAELSAELRIRLKDLAASRDTRGMLLACQTAKLVSEDLPIDVFERYLRVTVKLANLRYTPPRLPLTLTYFMASERQRPEWLAAWHEVADEVIPISVRGTHSSMVEPPHAEELGKRISEALGSHASALRAIA